MNTFNISKEFGLDPVSFIAIKNKSTILTIHHHQKLHHPDGLAVGEAVTAGGGTT
jgi:hypothetical protein